jgi:UDP-N-acetylglucosamine 2-epimerase (non-hydrolysing)
MQLLREVSKDVTVVFPIHPRTRERMAAGDIDAGGLILTPPLGYLDFLQLMSNCRFALTDSGGIQEETTVLGVPCLTMRENTERPVTIEQGTNRLVGTDPEGVKCAIAETLSHNTVRGAVPELWDGQASARIADILNRKLTQ